MTFEVKLSPQSAKFLRRQDIHIRERLKTALTKLREEPFQYLEHFEGADHYKYRIGDYRSLIDVDLASKIVWVRVLDKRGRIYK